MPGFLSGIASFQSGFYRLLAMGVKLGFLIAAARLMPAEDFSRFSWVSYLVVSLVFAAGMENYIVLARQISDRDWSAASITLTLSLWVMTGLIIALIFLPPSWSLICALALSEYAAQEIYRILLSRGEAGRAAFVFFLRSCGWSIPAVFVLLLNGGGWRTCLQIWILSNILVVLLYARPALRDFRWSGFHPFHALATPWRNLPLILSALAFLALGTADKLLIGFLPHAADAAGFYLYAAIISAGMTLCYTVVINPQLRELTGSLQPYGADQARLISRHCLVLLSLWLVVILLFSPFIVRASGLNIGANVLPLLISALSLLIFGLNCRFHYQLFIARRDRELAFTAAGVVLAMGIAGLLLYRRGDWQGAPLMPLAGWITALVLNLWHLRRGQSSRFF